MFAPGGVRTRLRNFRLRRLLGGAHVTAVSNHNPNASRTLVEVLRLPSARVVPWDWERLELAPTRIGGPSSPPLAVFAGQLSEAKGVGDCLEALDRLQAAGTWLRMLFAGGGDIAPWQARADALGIGAEVTFAGLLPNDELRRRMASADVVVVPSRHAYAEGLPNVIYEALAARTPLVMSDHPAFRGRLDEGQLALVFRAGDPADLARALTRLLDDPALWRRLVDGSEAAHAGLHFGIDWAELIDLFVSDPTDATGWVARNSLAALERR